jgi:acetate---CoA ligase (ADP-forming)
LELEKRVKSAARAHGIRMLGPNCLGVINTNKDVRMNATFSRLMPKRGNIALISQSGAMCVAILDFAEGRNMGFSKFVSIGNKADINEIDLLRYLKDDPDTDVILMYLEDVSEGHAFIEVAREITLGAGKPILALKAGRSPEGARAAASHTGSMAGSDSAYDAIFMQGGIQRVEGVSDLFNFALAFSTQPLPKGSRIAVVTNSGGPGIMATDALIRPGITMAPLSEETKEKLRSTLPPTASVQNPVDVIGDADATRYENAIRYTLEDDNVDGAIVILAPAATTEIMETARIVPYVAKDINKPILCSFMGLVDVSEGVRYLEQNGFPNYAFPEEASKTMGAMVRYAESLRPQKEQRREIFRLIEDQEKAAAAIAWRLSGRKEYFMTEKEAHELLRCYGLPLLKSRLVQDPLEIQSAVEEVGFPGCHEA